MKVNRSNISWTDYSGGAANIAIRGTRKGDCEVSPGCTNCYARNILARNAGMPTATHYSEKKLAALSTFAFVADPGDRPFRRGPGSRPLVFIADMGDLFHASVPTWFILEALALFQERSDVDWQVLTKRPARMAEIAAIAGWPANVWAGTSVENQKCADERIPLLLQVPAKVRFLSCEPLLSPVVLPFDYYDKPIATPRVNWLIVGAESGSQRRPFDLQWARDLRDQCAAAGVAYFFKQSSGLRPGTDDLLDGRAYKEFPPCQ